MASRTLAQSSDFSISYPPGFVASVVKPPIVSTNWRWDLSDPGLIVFKFDARRLYCGRSRGRQNVESQNRRRRIHRHLRFDAGISHYHDITAYRAVHGGQCYTIVFAASGRCRSSKFIRGSRLDLRKVEEALNSCQDVERWPAFGIHRTDRDFGEKVLV
jgi:hypothetical protein